MHLPIIILITFSDKFNGTVPGTFQPAADDDSTQQSADSTEEYYITTVDSVSTTVTGKLEPTTEVSIFILGGTLFYTTIGVGGGIIFSFTIIIVCILIGFSVRRKRKSKTSLADTTLEPHNGIQVQGRMTCCI